MKNAEGFVAQLDSDLMVHHQEVNASPMLDLVEVRTGKSDGDIEHAYYDRLEARKLSRELAEGAAELDQVDLDQRARASRRLLMNARYVVVREVAGGFRVLDRRTWCVLAAKWVDAHPEDAARWAAQLNESAASACAA